MGAKSRQLRDLRDCVRVTQKVETLSARDESKYLSGGVVMNPGGATHTQVRGKTNPHVEGGGHD